MDERIAVKRLQINVGPDANGAMQAMTHIAGDNKKLFVIPGRYAIVEATISGRGKVVCEQPFSLWGWEYDPI